MYIQNHNDRISWLWTVQKLSNLQKKIFHHCWLYKTLNNISGRNLQIWAIHSKWKFIFYKKNNQTLPPNAVLTQKCKEYLLAVKSEILLKENPLIKIFQENIESNTKNWNVQGPLYSKITAMSQIIASFHQCKAMTKRKFDWFHKQKLVLLVWDHRTWNSIIGYSILIGYSSSWTKITYTNSNSISWNWLIYFHRTKNIAQFQFLHFLHFFTEKMKQSFI